MVGLIATLIIILASWAGLYAAVELFRIVIGEGPKERKSRK